MMAIGVAMACTKSDPAIHKRSLLGIQPNLELLQKKGQLKKTES